MTIEDGRLLILAEGEAADEEMLICVDQYDMDRENNDMELAA